MPARRFFFHGFLMVLLSLCLGFVIAGVGGGPRGRVWLGAHTTGLMTGLLLVAAGAVWPAVRLGARAQRIAGFSLITGAWAGYWVLGVFASAMAMPLKVAAPDLPPVAGWPQAVVAAALIYVSLTLIGGCGMVVYGLAGREA
jgi:hydroxylaminobenzene mutase